MPTIKWAMTDLGYSKTEAQPDIRIALNYVDYMNALEIEVRYPNDPKKDYRYRVKREDFPFVKIDVRGKVSVERKEDATFSGAGMMDTIKLATTAAEKEMDSKILGQIPADAYYTTVAYAVSSSGATTGSAYYTVPTGVISLDNPELTAAKRTPPQAKQIPGKRKIAL